MKTTETTSHHRWLGCIVIIALTVFAFAVRWYYVSTAVVLDPVRGDATQYFSYAWNMVNHGSFSKALPGATVVLPDNYRDPGYPLFLALWMKLFGTEDMWYAVVLIAQATLGALTVTFVTLTARFWLPLQWASGAGVLMALWPHSVTINGYLLSETLFAFLTASGILACVTALRRRSRWGVFSAGLIIGAAALTNAILLPFGVLFALFLAWRKVTSRQLCVALALGTLALPCAWTIRNAASVVPVAGNSSADRALLNFVIGSWPDWQSDWRDTILGDESSQKRAKTEMHRTDLEYEIWRHSTAQGFQAFGHRALAQPLRFARWYLIEKPTLLWGWSIEIGQGDIYVYPTKNAPFQTQSVWIGWAAFCRGFNIWLMLLALGGILCSGRIRRKGTLAESGHSAEPQIAVMLLLVFVTIVYSTLQAEPRYSIPFRPFEILSAVSMLYLITAWIKRHRANLRPPPPTVVERTPSPM